MIGKGLPVFKRLFEMLRTLEANTKDLKLLGEVNRVLVVAIMDTEKKVLATKALYKRQTVLLKTSRPSKERASSLKNRIEALGERLGHLNDQLWLWRLFGDSVAHLYLDKFAIKHTFFETDTYDVKPDAGMMTGKSGLGGEIGLLLEALKHDVPAILCDVTNVLRYGDVCLLGESDPYLIEVKTSARLNQRGKRQAAKLERLQEFLKTDVATNFRGNPGEVRRVSVEVAEWSHAERLNECIVEAKANGCAIVSPEPGLSYVAIYDSDRCDMSKIDQSNGIAVYCSWNDAKNIPNWTYYVPFLITIRDIEHLLDFIEGRVVILIYADTETLTRHCSAPGWKAIFLENGNYSVACLHLASQGVMGLSTQMLYRVFYECVSLEWMGKSQVAAMARAWEENKTHYGPHRLIDQRAYVEQMLEVPYDELMGRFARAEEGRLSG